MGINVFSHWAEDYSISNPNPNPKNWIICKYEICGDYLLVLIKYPDCKNFEGHKILLYQGISSVNELLTKTNKIIDPHFSEKGISPIARFEPTMNG